MTQVNIPNNRILIIDDEEKIRQVYQKVLDQKDNDMGTVGTQIADLLSPSQAERLCMRWEFQLHYAVQGDIGIELVQKMVDQKTPFAAAFIDIRMPPGPDGMDTATQIRKIDPNIEIVIVTAYSDRTLDEIVKAVRPAEKLLFLRKPFDPEELVQMAISLTSKWNLARQEERTQAALRNSEKKFRSLVETINDWVWETDAQGVFTYCSPVSEMIYGYAPDHLLGDNYFEKLIEPHLQTEFRAFFNKSAKELKKFKQIEHTCLKHNGSIVHIETSFVPVIDDNGVIVGFRGIDRDISRRKKTEIEKEQFEKRYRQSQKLEAIGTLAGGIAHDFNNILSGILGYTEMAMHKLPTTNKSYQMLEKAMQAGYRAIDLVKQILSFSRKNEQEMRQIKWWTVVNEVLTLVRASLPSTIEIRKSFTVANTYIYADPTQIHQVLMNLCTNAAHAMSERGGMLDVHMSELEISPKDELSFPELKPGKYLKLSVSDTGCGIDSSIRDRIFEPFFTTREKEEGTGMGLAVVHGILKSHGGGIIVESELGKGSTFQVFLPAIKVDEGYETENTLTEIPSGTERILIVDDEPLLVELYQKMLESLDYTVTAAKSSTEALNLFKNDPDQFDLIITDQTMPKMTGLDLAKELIQIRPGIPIILCSGLCEAIMRERIEEIGIRAFVMKPYSLRDIAKNVRNVLDSQ